MELTNAKFKPSDVGVIPIDWNVYKLRELAQIKDGTHQTPRYVDVGVPFYSVETVTDNNFDKTKFISESEHKLLTKSFRIEKGDVLMTRIGSIGQCRYVDWEPNASFYVSLALLKFKNNCTAIYFSQYSNSLAFRREIELNSLLHAIPKKINLGQLGEIKIAAPSKELEQKAIASTLSDVDDMIAKLEKLIEKKKAVKQGAMQQLLTPPHKGGKRLAGFSGEWVEMRIEEITRNIIDYRGVTPKKLGLDWGNGNIVALSAGNVKKGFIDYKSECYLGSEALYKRWMRNGDVQKDDIVFTLEAPLGNLALIPDDRKYILSQRTILLQVKKDSCCSKFIFQLFMSDSFQKKIASEATGSTAQGIKRKSFEKLAVFVPNSLEEQRLISKVLFDLDNESDSLEGALYKYIQIKQGMMQELLTGRTRLI